MDNFFITTYSIVLPIVLSFLIWYLKRNINSKKTLEKGVMLLLETDMIMLFIRYTSDGTIPMYVYQHFIHLYDAYIKLGGDGISKVIKIEMDNLPIQTNKKIQ